MISFHMFAICYFSEHVRDVKVLGERAAPAPTTTAAAAATTTTTATTTTVRYSG